MSNPKKTFEYIQRTIATIILSIIFTMCVTQCCKAQNQDLNDAKHFYAAFAVQDFSYHGLEVLAPKQKVGWRLLTTSLIGFGAGFGKEQFDKTRCNRNKRTGFSKDDLFVDIWSIPVYVEFRICINDFKKRNK